MTNHLTVFTLGYAGWGRASQELKRAVDSVERSRGFRPPFFVDVRITRSARARDFSGAAFERLVGPSRYRWMKGLGDASGGAAAHPPIRIADPAGVGELLDLVEEKAKEKRRVVILASAHFPKDDGKVVSNRQVIGNLLLREARRRKRALTVVEWPGGQPAHQTVKVSRGDAKATASGRGHLALPRRPGPELLGLPWASIVEVDGEGERVTILAGPAEPQRHGWSLPVFWRAEDEGARKQADREARRVRRAYGLDPRP